MSEQELFVVQYCLSVHIFDHNPKRLRKIVEILVELEVALNGELHTQQVTGDGLHVPLELHLRNGVHELVDLAAELREVDQFSDLHEKKQTKKNNEGFLRTNTFKMVDKLAHE